MNDDQITVHATVTCAAWVAQHVDYEHAARMRDDFLEIWGFHHDIWNRELDQLINYAARQGADVTHFEAVRVSVIEV